MCIILCSSVELLLKMLVNIHIMKRYELSRELAIIVYLFIKPHTP